MNPWLLVRGAAVGIWQHRLRSFLTILGIVCGVGAVIAMLAIGEGEGRAAQERIERLGSRNVLLASVRPPPSSVGGGSAERVLSYGLSERDYEALRETIPEADMVVPRRDIPAEARAGSRRMRTTLLATTPEAAAVAGLTVSHGRFLETADAFNRRAVCVLGEGVARTLYLNTDPIGRNLLAGGHAWTVVGVLSARGEGTGATGGLGGESDLAVFVPLESVGERFGRVIQDNQPGNQVREAVELHRVTMRATDGTERTVNAMASAIRRLITQRRPQEDVRLTVPLELLNEARETKRRTTLILGSLAGVGLLVGGIGIMNIMLASVVERTREIGIRRALGARRSSIVLAFLTETLLLTWVGGLLGIGLGILLPHMASTWFGLRTAVEPWFLLLAFGISAAIGIVFGLYPALRASRLDPVEALRRE